MSKTITVPIFFIDQIDVLLLLNTNIQKKKI